MEKGGSEDGLGWKRGELAPDERSSAEAVLSEFVTADACVSFARMMAAETMTEPSVMERVMAPVGTPNWRDGG